MSIFDDSLFGPAPAPRRPQASLQPLTQEEQDSLLGSIGAGALHGLGYIGASLAKPGRAVRGLLAGKPRELLAAIPFSDAAGITDPADETHGSHFLGGDNDTPFFSPAGIGGLGIDIATDPLTYLSFGGGALTNLGKTAAKVGVLPGTAAGRLAGVAGADATKLARAASVPVSEVAGARLGGHVGVGLPFMGNAMTFDLTPAASALGAAGNVAARAPLVGPAVGASAEIAGNLKNAAAGMFYAPFRGQTDPVLQSAAARAETFANKFKYQELSKAAELSDWVQSKAGWKFGKPLEPFGKAIDDIGKQLVSAGERTPADWAKFHREFPNEAAAAAAKLATMDPDVVAMARKMRGWYDDYINQARQAGFGDKELEDFVQYMRRQSSLAHSEAVRSPAAPGLKPALQARRDKEFKGLYTEDINRLAEDAAIRQNPNLALAADDLRQRYLGWDATKQGQYTALKAKQGMALSPAELGEYGQLEAMLQANQPWTAAQAQQWADMNARIRSAMTQPEIDALRSLTQTYNQGQALASWQRQLDPAAIKQLGGFFTNHPQADFENYIGTMANRLANAKASYEALAKLSAPATGQGYKLGKVLEHLGLTGTTAQSHLANALAAEGKAGLLHSLEVTPKQYESLMKLAGIGQTQAAAKPWLSLFDSISNLWKAGATTAPQTLSRNFLSDIVSRWFHGGSALSPVSVGKTLREGQVVPGLAGQIPRFAGMTDKEATQALLTEAYRTGILQGKRYQTYDVAGLQPGVSLLRRPMTAVAAPKEGLLTSLANHLPGQADLQGVAKGEGRLVPWNVRGVGGRQTSEFFPVGLAQSTSTYGEDVNRLGTLFDALRRGFDPLQAAEQVTKAHHDFGALTDFEKHFMRRVFPFYSWQRANLPVVMAELAQNPGGRMGTTMRFLNAAAGHNQGLVPEQVAATGSPVPLGGPQDGRQRYATSLGMPFEDLTNLISMRQILASTSPLIRLPYEATTGQQIFSGQEMPGNFPVEGMPLANQIIMNSPAARVVSAARNLTNPNRTLAENAVQMLLGPRITSVDVDAARRQAIAAFAEEQLRTNPAARQYHRMYVPAEQIPLLSEQERLLLRLYQTQRQAPANASQQR